MSQRLKGRPESLIDSTTEAAEVITYRPMPPKRSFPMHVSLRMTGRGRPMPFTPDDIAPNDR